MADNNKTANGIGLGTLIFLIFLFLKLAGMGEVANWSWWWVTSPLWIPAVLVIGFLIFVLIIKAFCSIFE
jgi:hypothetical protein